MIKVLYVEDNDDNVYMLKMRLELLGDFEVLAAEDGEKGCEMAVSERPDIILMDLEMPVMDGWQATRRLKSTPGTSEIPIIGLSAHALVHRFPGTGHLHWDSSGLSTANTSSSPIAPIRSDYARSCPSRWRSMHRG